VLPMYLLIGIWGSRARSARRASSWLGLPADPVSAQGIRGDEADPDPSSGRPSSSSAFGALRRLGFLVLSLSEMEGIAFQSGAAVWVFLASTWASASSRVSGRCTRVARRSRVRAHGGVQLHAGVLMKLGAYGVLRLGFGLLPDGAAQWVWLVGTIGCVNIVYGALSSMAQTDLKYVIATRRCPTWAWSCSAWRLDRDRAQRVGLPRCSPTAS